MVAPKDYCCLSNVICRTNNMIERFIVTHIVVIVRVQLYHIGPEYHGYHKHFIFMDEK